MGAVTIERAQLEQLLRRIDEMRADVVRALGGDERSAAEDDEDLRALAAEHAADMRRRRVGVR